MAEPALSWFVNDAGAYVLAISAVPDEHLHRPLVVTVGDDTLLDETDPCTDATGCAWCEEADAPTYMASEGHDPQCPLRPEAILTEVRAGELAVGHSYAKPGLDEVTVAAIAFHGDTVLITAPDGARHALDRDVVVQVATYRPRPALAPASADHPAPPAPSRQHRGP